MKGLNKKFKKRIEDFFFNNIIILTISLILISIFGLILCYTNFSIIEIIGMIIVLLPIFFLFTVFLIVIDFELPKNKNKTIVKVQIEDSIKKEESNIPRDINSLIFEIDNKLNDGFVFQTISKEKWNNSYKTQILNLCNSKYAINAETKKRILNILNILSNDLIDQKKEEDAFNKDATLCALESLLILDGLHK